MTRFFLVGGFPPGTQSITRVRLQYFYLCEIALKAIREVENALKRSTRLLYSAGLLVSLFMIGTLLTKPSLDFCMGRFVLTQSNRLNRGEPIRRYRRNTQIILSSRQVTMYSQEEQERAVWCYLLVPRPTTSGRGRRDIILPLDLYRATQRLPRDVIRKLYNFSWSETKPPAWREKFRSLEFRTVNT